MLRRSAPYLLAITLPTAAYFGCGTDSSTFDTPPDAASPGTSGNTSGTLEAGPRRDGGSSGSFGPGCGNSFIEDGELCDDGNESSGDGCSSDCKTIEEGYSCVSEGQACAAICGDAVKLGDEDCDDGNTKSGDGCSDGCRLEVGFKCTTVGAACETTTCGDNVVEGTEQCDDTLLSAGPDRPFDGCYNCVKEPTCGTNGCTGACGDGVILGAEACDDGNVRDGDGCSSTCTIEPGFACENRTEELPAQLVLPVVYLDFKSNNAPSDVTIPFANLPEATVAGGHPDFERFFGYGAYRDLVKDTLGGDGRPQFNKASAIADPCVIGIGNARHDQLCNPEIQQLTGASEFNEWYNDGARNSPVVQTLTLGRVGSTSTYVFDSDAQAGGGQAFFPLDPANTSGAAPGLGFGREFGKVCRDQNLNSSLLETDTCQESRPPSYAKLGVIHNFLFTTELRYWFTFHSAASDAEAPSLNFTGDDDVWIFINGRRVVDLGGMHSKMGHDPLLDGAPRQDRTTYKLTAANAATLGLTDKGVYEISLFHADRHSTGSNFKFTLGGFEKTRTFCEPTCGDGVKTKNETCDNGAANNTGGYNQCAADCTWGPRCGDGIVQAGEACDDGNFKKGDDCDPDCTIPPGIN